MTNERMIELLNNFINHLTECNSNAKDTIMSLNGIGMKQEEWEELGWDLESCENNNEEYKEIEFFEGDQGDLDAEKYADEEGLEPGSYEIEWDDYRKGYSLKTVDKN